MKGNSCWMLLLTVALGTGTLLAQTPLGTAFTYQGRLTDGDAPANGTYDLQFALYESESGGSQMGSPVEKEGVAVVDGYFTVTLDFGSAAFAGQARWLQIGVRPGASIDPYMLLSGRQELTPTPNAIYAGNSGALAGQAQSYYLDLANHAGVLSVAHGGTGAATAAEALAALGAAPVALPQSLPSTSTIDSTGGTYTSVTIGADGLGLISYRGTGGISVAHCDNTACTGATVSNHSSASIGGYSTSIAIGTDGLGLISYDDGDMLSPSNLKAAHCENTACTSVTSSTIDSGGDVGPVTSITIGADGLGLISYQGASNLRVAHCNNTACTGATISTIDSGGSYNSVTIGADGLGLISYQSGSSLKVAHCNNTTCTSAATSTIDSTGLVSSVTIGADGLGLISYQGTGGLKVARCNNTACSSSTTSILDSTGYNPGNDSSITIGADGLGLISYNDGLYMDPGVLKVAHCNDTACTSATISVADGASNVGYYTSVTIGADGLGLISYHDFTKNDLKVAHCSNALCNPYIRRR